MANTSAASSIAALLLTSVHVPDAIEWRGKAADVPHHKDFGCIDPPPFGQQCTVHASGALHACLAAIRANSECHSFSCPSPEPYTRGQRRDGISGPICQLRAVQLRAWHAGAARARRHGMCSAQGCRNFFLQSVRIQLPGGRRRPPWRYELILAAPNPEEEAYLGLPREAASTLPSSLVEEVDGDSSVGPRPKEYHLYALDRGTAGKAFDLAGITHKREGGTPRPAKKPEWLNF